MYSIDFETEASLEMQNAYDWYEMQQIGLGEKLFSILDEYFELFCKNPFQNPIIYKKKRAVFIQDFQYLIIYAVYDTKVIVYSVFHTKRNPKIWKKR